ncbi:hypothetical protein SAMN05660666_02510 [Novosphingobium aromaticivorans]|nr:hypothetical protein SAMN05660666_02510 [Novosphingobium aromaticivorans]
MSEICIQTDFMLGILTEIGRHRALSNRETDIIEDCIAFETAPFRWNARLDNALLVASHSPGGIARFARRHEITGGMAYARLHRLRKRQKRKDARNGQEG